MKREGDYRNIRNSIGMFDMLKGIGMLVVVLGHTVSDYIGQIMSASIGAGIIFSLIFSIMGAIVIPMFLIISGYGFRKRPVKKCIRQQIRLMLKPYLCVMAVTTVLFLCVHYACFRYLPASLTETVRVFGGFLFALPEPMELFQFNFFSCGVVWYIVALFLGWMILDILMNCVPEQRLTSAVLCIVLIGWAMSLYSNLPFCLVQGFVAVGYLYLGYKIKKKKIFFLKLPIWVRVAIALSFLAEIGIIAESGSVDNVASASWALGPIGILFNGWLAWAAVYVCLPLNQKENFLFRVLRVIGRNSLHIFCIHTIELVVIPWYLILPEAAPWMRCIVMLLLRTLLISGVCVMINYGKIMLPSRRKRKMFRSGREVY